VRVRTRISGSVDDVQVIGLSLADFILAKTPFMVEWLLYAHLRAFIVVAKELKPVVVLLFFPLLGLYGSWAREVLGTVCGRLLGR
jgi:hypothetical protein